MRKKRVIVLLLILFVAIIAFAILPVKSTVYNVETARDLYLNNQDSFNYIAAYMMEWETETPGEYKSITAETQKDFSVDMQKAIQNYKKSIGWNLFKSFDECYITIRHDTLNGSIPSFTPSQPRVCISLGSINGGDDGENNRRIISQYLVYLDDTLGEAYRDEDNSHYEAELQEFSVGFSSFQKIADNWYLQTYRN